MADRMRALSISFVLRCCSILMSGRWLHLGGRKQIKRFSSHSLVMKRPIVIFLLPFALLQLVNITPLYLFFDESIVILLNIHSDFPLIARLLGRMLSLLTVCQFRGNPLFFLILGIPIILLRMVYPVLHFPLILLKFLATRVILQELIIGHIPSLNFPYCSFLLLMRWSFLSLALRSTISSNSLSRRSAAILCR